MRSLILCLVCLSVGFGCGGGSDKFKASRPKTVPAGGILTRKGTPVGGALITFVPKTPDGTAASALTSEDGSFEMQAFPPDSGAVPGQYTAVVVKNPVDDTAPAAADSHDAPPPKPKKGLLPEKYGKASTSTILIDLPEEGRTDMKIDIKE